MTTKEGTTISKLTFHMVNGGFTADFPTKEDRQQKLNSVEYHRAAGFKTVSVNGNVVFLDKICWISQSESIFEIEESI